MLPSGAYRQAGPLLDLSRGRPLAGLGGAAEPLAPPPHRLAGPAGAEPRGEQQPSVWIGARSWHAAQASAGGYAEGLAAPLLAQPAPAYGHAQIGPNGRDPGACFGAGGAGGRLAGLSSYALFDLPPSSGPSSGASSAAPLLRPRGEPLRHADAWADGGGAEADGWADPTELLGAAFGHLEQPHQRQQQQQQPSMPAASPVERAYGGLLGPGSAGVLSRLAGQGAELAGAGVEVGGGGYGGGGGGGYGGGGGGWGATEAEALGRYLERGGSQREPRQGGGAREARYGEAARREPPQ